MSETVYLAGLHLLYLYFAIQQDPLKNIYYTKDFWSSSILKKRKIFAPHTVECSMPLREYYLGYYQR